MSTSTEAQTGRERSTVYIVSAVVLGIMMVIGLLTYRAAKSSREADEKADQFIASLEAAGAVTPEKDQIVRVLGEDGGATCANPNDSLNRAVFLSQLANGASGPGSRPVIADSRVVQGQLLIIKTYCPDELKQFQEFVDGLKTDNVAGS